MCIIVDASCLGEFLSDPVNEDAAPIHKWLTNRGGRIIYSTGGAFEREVGRQQRNRLTAYVRAGQARVIPAGQFASDEQALRARTDRRSDDPHVLALARATSVRLLYTNDRNLIEDFKNKKFIDHPRGKVYSRAANAGLLTRAVCGLVSS